eukprot:6185007-Pleurochrysis_carterae.AAC.1
MRPADSRWSACGVSVSLIEVIFASGLSPQDISQALAVILGRVGERGAGESREAARAPREAAGSGGRAPREPCEAAGELRDSHDFVILRV